jgi:SAM-dependent methyltransferase
MSRHDDAFGHLIHDFHCGMPAREIIERDDGLIDVSSGPAAYFTGYPDWPADERRAVDLARGRVLDIGCGAGRHALYLQGRGLDVVGIDLSPLAVRTCRERGLRDVRVLGITQVGSGLGRFDTILMMGSNFGLLASMSRARWLLRKFRSITSESAFIIAESADPHDTVKPCHLDYHRINLERGRLPGQVRIRVRYQTLIGEWFDYLKVSRDEMKMVIEGTGWHVARFIPGHGTVYSAILNKVKEP